jgi:hypothetical protein
MESADLCEICGRRDCDEWNCTRWSDDGEFIVSVAGHLLINSAMVQSTIDDAVKAIRLNTDHEWATFAESGTAGPSWEYCTRCGRKKEDLELPIAGTYLPCKGFVG